MGEMVGGGSVRYDSAFYTIKFGLIIPTCSPAHNSAHVCRKVFQNGGSFARDALDASVIGDWGVKLSSHLRRTLASSGSLSDSQCHAADDHAAYARAGSPDARWVGFGRYRGIGDPLSDPRSSRPGGGQRLSLPEKRLHSGVLQIWGVAILS